MNDIINDPTKFPNSSYLIGDAAYTLHEHLIVPYRDNGHLSQKQKNFNFCHSSARMAIERSFGFLKGRFRSLLTTLAMDRVDLIPKYIIACCVLHNICLLKNDEVPIAIDIPSLIVENNPIPREIISINHHRGILKKDDICEQLPIRQA